MRDGERLMSQTLKFVTIVLTIAVVAISSILFLVATQRDDLKKQAVERGFAEWVVDPNGQTTTWQWKEAK